MTTLRHLFLALLGLVLGTAGLRAAHDPAGAYAWIRQQQRPSGLFANQQEDTFSGLYVDALAAFCLVHQGEVAAAEKLFDHLDAWRKDKAHWGDELSKQGFPQAWNADTGEADLASDRWVGDNAWLLLALEYHRKKTGSDRYAGMRDAVADWLVALQDPADGGIWAGFNRNGAMKHKSTEGNLDCYAALTMRPEARAGVHRWLTEKMWVPTENRFRTGSTSDYTALDCVSWAVAALGADYAKILEYAEKHYVRSAPMDALPGKTAEGFGDLPGKDRVWFEGTGEMIVAYRVAGRDADAERWIAAMDAVAVPAQTVGHGWPCSSNDPAWRGASTHPFIASGAWYLMGVWKLNPMNPASW